MNYLTGIERQKLRIKLFVKETTKKVTWTIWQTTTEKENEELRRQLAKTLRLAENGQDGFRCRLRSFRIDIYRQCHRLPICFLTSDLTNSETRLPRPSDSGCGIFDGLSPQLKEKCLKDAVFGRLALIHIWIKSWVGFGDHKCIAQELGGAFLSISPQPKSSNLGKQYFFSFFQQYFSSFFRLQQIWHKKREKYMCSQIWGNWRSDQAVRFNGKYSWKSERNPYFTNLRR